MSNYLITARISSIRPPSPFGWVLSHSPAFDSFLGLAVGTVLFVAFLFINTSFDVYEI